MPPPTSAVVAQASTALGGGFFNAMCVSDEETALVTLHGAGYALGGGDIWGLVASAPDPNLSGSPRGGLRYWRGAQANLVLKTCLGAALSRVTAGRGYVYQGTGKVTPASPQPANSGAITWTSDYGLTWTTRQTGDAPANYQTSQPRAVGHTILARAVAGKDQIIIAGYDGLYSSQDVTASGGHGLVKVALGTTGQNVGGTCVGLARDPNNPDVIYVAVRDTFGGSSLKLGVYQLTVNTSGVAGAATLLGGVAFAAEEVFAVNEGGTTAVYAVGANGLYRFKSGSGGSYMGNLPTGIKYSCIGGFYDGTAGKTTLVVGHHGGPPQIWWTRVTPGATAAWTALDTKARAVTPGYPVYGQSDSPYWPFGPNGKASAFALGQGNNFDPSQIIALPAGSASADVFLCGRTTIYELPDAANTGVTWQVCGKGTNASEAHFVSARPGGGAKFSHGDADFSVTTSNDGYATVMPRIHAPNGTANPIYLWTPMGYDEFGGLYVGGSPAGSFSNTDNGHICYHPDPHQAALPGALASNGWQTWVTPPTNPGGARCVGAFGFWKDTKTRVLICTVYKDKTYRRVDTCTTSPTGPAGTTIPAGWTIGTWAAVPSLAVNVTAGVRFARGTSGAVYCLDPARGLCRSDDNGLTWPVIDATFSGGGNDMDNDPAAADCLVLTQASSAWIIPNARTAPGTKSKIADSNRVPNCGPVAFDRDPAYRTGSVSRLWLFNNAASAGNPSLYFSDDHGTTWKASGGPNLGDEVHTAADMAASNGYVVTASYIGGVKTMVPVTAGTDATAPTPNPLTFAATSSGVTVQDSRTLAVVVDTASDPSGVDHYTVKAYAALTGGSAVATATLSGPTGTITVPTGGTNYYVTVTATDAAPTPNTTAEQTTRLGPFATPADPTGPPVGVLTLTDNGDATVTADITGTTNYSGNVTIAWPDGSTTTIPQGSTADVPHLFTSFGTFLVTATFFNTATPAGAPVTNSVTVVDPNAPGPVTDFDMPVLESGDNLLVGSIDNGGTGLTLKDKFNALSKKVTAALNAISKGDTSVVPSLLARAAGAQTTPIPPVAIAGDIPTVTSGGSATLTAQLVGAQTGLVTEVGSRGTYDPVAGRLPVSGKSGLDFYLTGTAVEIHVFPGLTGACPIWIWVNGAPATATPSSVTVTSSTDVYVKLTFGSADRRRIEFFMPHGGSWYEVSAAASAVITPAPRKPVVAWVGDSFYGGSSGTPAMQCADFLASRMLGVECYSQSFGGTGYVTAGSFNTFGDPARVAAVAAADPDLIVMQGSVNDDGGTGIQAAAAAAFTAYAAACPQAKLIVLGPQPNAATQTLSTNRSANAAAVATAAAAAPNVLAFHDLVGTAAGVPATVATFQTYPDGTLVKSLGSVWKVSNGGTAWANGPHVPPTDSHYALQTWVYFGTGQVGTTTGDGNRDTLVYSDGIHPTVEASVAFALRTAETIRADLASA